MDERRDFSSKMVELDRSLTRDRCRQEGLRRGIGMTQTEQLVLVVGGTAFLHHSNLAALEDGGLASVTDARA